MFIFSSCDPRGTLFPNYMVFGDRTIVLHCRLHYSVTSLSGFSFVFNNKTALWASDPFINLSYIFCSPKRSGKHLLAQSWKCKQLETKLFSRKGTLRIMWSNLLLTHFDTVAQGSQGTNHSQGHVTLHRFVQVHSQSSPHHRVSQNQPVQNIPHTGSLYPFSACFLKKYLYYLHA